MAGDDMAEELCEAAAAVVLVLVLVGAIIVVVAAVGVAVVAVVVGGVAVVAAAGLTGAAADAFGGLDLEEGDRLPPAETLLFSTPPPVETRRPGPPIEARRPSAPPTLLLPVLVGPATDRASPNGETAARAAASAAPGGLQGLQGTTPVPMRGTTTPLEASISRRLGMLQKASALEMEGTRCCCCCC